MQQQRAEWQWVSRALGRTVIVTDERSAIIVETRDDDDPGDFRQRVAMRSRISLQFVVELGQGALLVNEEIVDLTSTEVAELARRLDCPRSLHGTLIFPRPYGRDLVIRRSRDIASKLGLAIHDVVGLMLPVDFSKTDQAFVRATLLIAVFENLLELLSRVKDARVWMHSHNDELQGVPAPLMRSSPETVLEYLDRAVTARRLASMKSARALLSL